MQLDNFEFRLRPQLHDRKTPTLVFALHVGQDKNGVLSDKWSEMQLQQNVCRQSKTFGSANLSKQMSQLISSSRSANSPNLSSDILKINSLRVGDLKIIPNGQIRYKSIYSLYILHLIFSSIPSKDSSDLPVSYDGSNRGTDVTPQLCTFTRLRIQVVHWWDWRFS